MIKKGAFSDLKENETELQALKDHRQKVRYAYSGKYAVEQFIRFLFSAKLFDRIEDKEDAIKHNMAIDILEDGGYLDQTVLKKEMESYFESVTLFDSEMLESGETNN